MLAVLFHDVGNICNRRGQLCSPNYSIRSAGKICLNNPLYFFSITNEIASQTFLFKVYYLFVTICLIQIFEMKTTNNVSEWF